jgi:two-component system sensor histidine kinase AlgZ
MGASGQQRSCTITTIGVALQRWARIGLSGRKQGPSGRECRAVVCEDARQGSRMLRGAGPESVVRETVQGLLRPQRLIPVLLVSIPMLVAQQHLSRPRPAILLGLALCTAFVLVAPVSWRVLFPEGMSGGMQLVRLSLYGAVGAGTVLTIGVAIPKLLGIGSTFMTARTSLVISMALFLVGGWGLGRDIGFERGLARERARADALAREAERAQLLALRAHLDPHFLFNTLNSIAEWCRRDGEVAERAVLQLSSILRAVLEGVKSAFWPLQREIDLVETLFALHRLRDPALFDLRLEVGQSVADIPVPTLILLPLAENAVTHGSGAGHRGPIVFRAERTGDCLSIQLENAGPFRGRRPEGSGIAMVEQRLELAYCGAARLRVGESAGRTKVELDLPLGGPDAGTIA